MSEVSKSWQALLMDNHRRLFETQVDGRLVREGYPEVGDGWRDLVETAVGRIAAAVTGTPDGALKILQIKTKFGSLRLYWRSDGLSRVQNAAVVEAVDLAEARSACTCEICGSEGGPWSDHGWMLTACAEHARGRPLAVRPGVAGVVVERRMVAGRLQVQRRRRYVRTTDSFVELPVSDGEED
ncbi:MAG: hypothetical protein JWO25_1920 [Alphaproteobacteria bacterium]|nr:hypothetical protein [Alphaproteobacteria bacterium]